MTNNLTTGLLLRASTELLQADAVALNQYHPMLTDRQCNNFVFAIAMKYKLMQKYTKGKILYLLDDVFLVFLWLSIHY